MSLKKDRFNSFDKKYMNFAINLASNQSGLTGTNPSVGCVIVKNKKIISFATTHVNGRPHAETRALKKCYDNPTGSTIYLSLEPCSHFGLTPPCTKAIIKSKVRKVYYSIEDYDLRSNKKSKKILISNKILTKSGLLKIKAKKLYKKYEYIKKNKLPFVVGKLACSSNLFIFKSNKLITNEHSRKVGHLLRYRNQGILTSYKTINTDNPKLSCRINGLENSSPVKLIIDRDLKINMKSYIIKNSKKNNTIIFHNSKNLKKLKKLKLKNIKLVYTNIDKNGHLDIKKILTNIYKMDIHNLLVESGKKLTNAILSKKLFNEFYLFKSNKNINNKQTVNVKNIYNTLNKTFKCKKKINTYLDKDTLIHYY